MATTRIMPMHIIKGQSVAYTVHERLDYAMNPAKTRGGELVTAYGCDKATAAAEMLLTKRNYGAFTGKAVTQKDVLLYQIRQSFKPGEVTPEQAQEIGCKLAMRFTKGRHQFIVATHIDQEHIHTHIIYNSTNMDATRKFRDFLGSGFAVRRISDRLCLEHGLSIVENPKRGNKHYGKWLGDKKPLSYQDKLRLAIDEILSQKPPSFDAFLSAMQTAGYEIKPGKHLAFRAPGQKKFTRLRALGDGYSEQEIRAVIAGKTPLSPSRSKAVRQEPQRVNLLVDIQAKLQAGKSAGYERWAKVFNLKQMAQTLNFLTENNLLEYADWRKKRRRRPPISIRCPRRSRPPKRAWPRSEISKRISLITPKPATFTPPTARLDTAKNSMRKTLRTSSCTRRRKRPLIRCRGRKSQPSRRSRPSMKRCWQTRKKPTPSTPSNAKK